MAAVSGGRGARGATHIVVDWEVIVDVTGDSLSADLCVRGVVVLHLCICRRKKNSIVCFFFPPSDPLVTLNVPLNVVILAAKTSVTSLGNGEK